MQQGAVKETPQSKFDQGAPDHDADIYAPAATAESYEGFEEVEANLEKAVQEFEENGFLSIQNAFTANEVTDCVQALNDIIDGKNASFEKAMEQSDALAKEGKLDFKTGTRHPFIQFESFAKDMPPDQRADHIRKFMGFADYDTRAHHMAFHPRLLSLLSRLAGGVPVSELKLFQDMALLKGVRGREKPWHQDHAYFNVAVNTRVIGVWVAIDEATPENGCMRCLPGLHRSAKATQVLSQLSPPEGLSQLSPPAAHLLAPRQGEEAAVFTHFMRRDYQLCDTLVRGCGAHITSVPLRPGGVMVFDSKLPHGTPTNHTNTRRRAAQFHYAIAQQEVSDEERRERFGHEGVDVQC